MQPGSYLVQFELKMRVHLPIDFMKQEVKMNFGVTGEFYKASIA